MPRAEPSRARDRLAWGALFACTLFASGCASRERPPASAPAHRHPRHAPPPPPAASSSAAPSAPGARPFQSGEASWYGAALAGRRTASGERFDPGQLTAAHRTLPFGTWVEVRRVDNGRTVRVRINDRGPNGRAKHRVIDLSRRAAEQLDMVRAGVARVELRVVGAR